MESRRSFKLALPCIARRQEEKEYMPTRTDAVLRRGGISMYIATLPVLLLTWFCHIEYRMGCVLRYLRKRGAHARGRVTLFLKENGFEHDVNSKKKGRFGLTLRCSKFRQGQVGKLAGILCGLVRFSFFFVCFFAFRYLAVFNACILYMCLGFNYTYPLHLAVSQKNVDITNLLLEP